MCEEFEESYSDRVQAMRGSIELAVKDYDRTVFGVRKLFEGQKMTRVEKFVPELRESKDIESLEEMHVEYDKFDIEHLYQFCKENPINKAKQNYQFMKLERTKELDDVVSEIWNFWHMPVDQM